jgi:L-alanine-DL-glutamate epimerase-like enolase superfamily enzyme
MRVRHEDGSVALGEGESRERAIPFNWPAGFGRHYVPVNGLVRSQRIGDLVAEARSVAEAGYGTVKLKVGMEASLTELVSRVEAVRETIGPGVRLRLDANGAWAEREALVCIGAVCEYDIEYVEQPISWVSSAEALARIRNESPVPVAADESVTSVASARELLEARAADVLVVKLARVGGPAAAAEIAAMAADVEVSVVVSTLFETGVGIAAALAAAARLPLGLAHGLATADLLVSDLLARPLEIKGGRMFVPESIELDEEALDRYAVERVGEWA